MSAATMTIDVEPGSELARLLDEADNKPLILIKGGVRYRIDREPSESATQKSDPWAGYDPERVREAVRAGAGTLSEEEAERWIENIYRWREEGSRPPDRP